MSDEDHVETLRRRLRQVAELVDRLAPSPPPQRRAERAIPAWRPESCQGIGALLGLAVVVVLVAAGLLSWQLYERGKIAANASPETRTPTGTMSGPIPSPTSVGGWPVSLANLAGEPIGAFGADGSFFVADQERLFAYDPSGRLRSGWPIAVPFKESGGARALAVASDGTLIVAGQKAIAVLDLSAKSQRGWPVSLPADFSTLFVHGEEVVVVAQAPQADQSEVQAFRLSEDGRPLWSRQVQGIVWDSAFADDGTIYLEINPPASSIGTHGFGIIALGTDGHELTGWPVSGFDGMAVAHSGLVVWSYQTRQDLAAGKMRVDRTTLTALNSSGQVLPGWPRTFEGPVSSPALGADGTIYLVAGTPDGASSGSVVALDQAGGTVPGWPVKMPAGYSGYPAWSLPSEPFVAMAPVVGQDIVVVPETSLSKGSVATALDQSGATLPGWPYALSGGLAEIGNGTPVSRVQSPRISPIGTIFVLGEDTTGEGSIVALNPGGQETPGWPQTYAYALRQWRVLDDGGVCIWDGTTVTRYTSAGNPFP
jgi:hypothetical protein